MDTRKQCLDATNSISFDTDPRLLAIGLYMVLWYRYRH